MRGRHKDVCMEDRMVSDHVRRYTWEPERFKSRRPSWEVGSG
jgi:hypothetical protein